MRVLIADDDPMSQHRLKALVIQWGYEPIVVDSGDAAWKVLQGDDVPPLLILDWMMPGMNGLEICTKLRQSQLSHYGYVILLTGKDSREDIIVGLESGADDYITKPFDAHELRARLNAGRRIVTLQAKLISAREELRERATHDSLTGLWNRAAIMEILTMEHSRLQRESKPGALAILDLDHFKAVNDTYGHVAGDTVLCQSAQRIRKTLRAYDAVGRFGGEEFLIVMSGCDVNDALALAGRIRTAISEPIRIPAETLQITASLGVACWREAAEFDLKRLLRAADASLYRAKDSGRNRVELAKNTDFTQRQHKSRPSHSSALLERIAIR